MARAMRINERVIMDKLQAINKCKELLAAGIYARPMRQYLTDRWDILILHANNTVSVPAGLTLIDWVFYRWEGMYKTQDYPIVGVL